MDDAALRFAKILIETGHTSGLTRDTYHREIQKRALETKRPTESTAQSYARYITETDDGKLLFKAAVRGPAPVQAAQDFVPRSKPAPAGPASKELNELARYMARNKGISFEQAHAELQSDTDPERKALVARVRREELDATRIVRDARWPITASAKEYSK